MYDFYLKPVKTFIALYLVLCLLLVNCSQFAKKVEKDVVPVENNDVRKIAVLKNNSDSKRVNLSSIASNIDYCILETNEKCLVSYQMNFFCTKDYIVSIGMDAPMHEVCYVFDRKTGNFVRQISRMGQGPGEYTEAVSDFWDEKNEQVCLWSHPDYIFYNLDGTISHKINRNEHPFLPSVVYGDYYVRYIPNTCGNETKRIVFHDRTGALFDSIPNLRIWEKKLSTIGGGGMSSDAKFYVFRNELYYKDMYCDTLYHIKNNILQPRYIFDICNLTVPYQMHSWSQDDLSAGSIGKNRYENYVVIESLFEDIKHLYFTFDYRWKRYPAIYEKKECVLKIMPPIAIPPPSRNWIFPLYGFENDIDGGLPFWPKQMISEKEMMCVYTAEELLELDVSEVTDIKLKNVLENLEFDSNPVVAIVTIKN